MDNTVTIIDSIMGSGKTTWAINYMKSHREKSFIYITPFLDECKRIQTSCAPELDFVAPVRKWPRLSKLDNIQELINAGENIVSSHELFKRFDDNVKSLLLYSVDYTLVIDEVLDIITPYKITKDDIRILKSSNVISIDNNGLCHWNKDMDDYSGRYDDIRQIAISGNLVCVDNTFFLWRYNPEIFKLFKDIFIMTYLFDGSIMKGYFDYYGIKYNKMSLHEGKLIPYQPFDTTKIQKLINIYEGKLNDGFTKSALSKTWYEDRDNTKYINQLRNNLDNYYRHIVNAKSDSRLWTTFEDNKETIEKQRYKNNFIPCNSRATNIYEDKYNLAYLVNIYMHPGIIHFLAQKQIVVNKELYALSVLLQWIWRSRIRNGLSINIYIPSKRMRELFKSWLNNTSYLYTNLNNINPSE